jgi:hypothetical protein
MGKLLVWFALEEEHQRGSSPSVEVGSEGPPSRTAMELPRPQRTPGLGSPLPPLHFDIKTVGSYVS